MTRIDQPWICHPHPAVCRAVKGVFIYVSDFKRSLPDKLSKNFFAEPSQVPPSDVCSSLNLHEDWRIRTSQTSGELSVLL